MCIRDRSQGAEVIVAARLGNYGVSHHIAFIGQFHVVKGDGSGGLDRIRDGLDRVRALAPGNGAFALPDGQVIAVLAGLVSVNGGVGQLNGGGGDA